LDLRCDVTYEAVAKIDKLFKGHPQQVMDSIWGATYARYKHVIVVDKDIDIWDYNSVHWALSTRVKADRDDMYAGDTSSYPSMIVSKKCMEKGVYLGAFLPNTLRVSPALTVTEEEVDGRSSSRSRWGPRSP
jgi:hypothetical protein